MLGNQINFIPKGGCRRGVCTRKPASSVCTSACLVLHVATLLEVLLILPHCMYLTFVPLPEAFYAINNTPTDPSTH